MWHQGYDRRPGVLGGGTARLAGVLQAWPDHAQHLGQHRRLLRSRIQHRRHIRPNAATFVERYRGSGVWHRQLRQDDHAADSASQPDDPDSVQLRSPQGQQWAIGQGPQQQSGADELPGHAEYVQCAAERQRLRDRPGHARPQSDERVRTVGPGVELCPRGQHRVRVDSRHHCAVPQPTGLSAEVRDAYRRPHRTAVSATARLRRDPAGEALQPGPARPEPERRLPRLGLRHDGQLLHQLHAHFAPGE